VTAALELSEIRKRFGALTAVDGVSLSVAQGQVLALVGENGAGKSTLISVACGLYKADAGSVRAFGRELRPGDARAAIDAGIGVVHQHFMLVGPLTVWENVVLGREPRRFGLIDVARPGSRWTWTRRSSR
jgi:simple sugar transport system ATP-binding protein